MRKIVKPLVSHHLKGLYVLPKPDALYDKPLFCYLLLCWPLLNFEHLIKLWHFKSDLSPSYLPLIDSLSPCLIMLTFSLNSSIIPFIRHSSKPNPFQFHLSYPSIWSSKNKVHQLLFVNPLRPNAKIETCIY